MTAVLLILAVLGWLLSVVGAVLDARGATKYREDETIIYLSHRPDLSRWALVLIIGGASVGAIGTILAVLVTG